ncbi:MAG: hypothetical protein M1820_002772 [Bogoriella megaspora]|nr:MAG: hypothetical protein M1820_002772 [Bogoriella megaspora]
MHQDVYGYEPIPDLRANGILSKRLREFRNSAMILSPLPQLKSTIRILKLKPGNEDDDIACSMEFRDLFQPGTYEALSYVWGSNNKPYSISCEGKSLAVTENCYTALKALRSTESTVAIWIDAICIHQDDSQERSDQVQLMRYIYAGARRVIVWLGEETANDRDALRILEKLERHVVKPWGKIDGLRGILRNTTSLPAERVIEASFLSTDALKQILHLFQRPWFERLWVVQEVRNSREAVVVCGESQISYDLLGKAASILNFNLTSIPGQIAPLGATIGEEDLVKLIERTGGAQSIRQLEQDKLSNRYSFFQKMISVAIPRACSDPRDKVYAALGLWSRRDIPEPLIPDYTSDECTVYRKFARYMILVEREFDFLSVAGQRDNLSGNDSWPSWVVDWGKARKDPPFHAVVPYWSLNIGGAVRIPPEVTPEDILRLPGKPLEIIKALNLATIDETAALRARDDIMNGRKLNQGAREWFTTTLQFASSSDAAVEQVIQTDRAKDFLRILFHDIQFLNYKVVAGSDIRKIQQLMAASLSSSGEQGEGQAQTPPTLSTPPADIHWSFISHKVLCTTSNNDRLGWVTVSARVGDAVAVFYGGRLPFLLRPIANGRYRLVGDCWVDGLMNKKAFSSSAVPDQLFEIE